MSLKNNQGSEVSCFTSTKDGIYYGTNSGCIQFKVHSGKVLSITPISNSRMIATFADGTIKILGPIVKVEDTLNDNSNSIWKVIEIGEKLYSIGSDNTLKIWKKTDGNYKVEESIAIQGTPKDLTKVNEDEVIIKLENQNSAVFVNLKTKEQKTLEEFQNFESLDNSLFLVDNKIVLVEKNRLKLINPEKKQVIFTLDNKDANILEVTCEKNLLTTIQSTEDKQLIGRVIFMVENDKIIKVNGGNFIKNTYELLDLCKYLEVQKEINEILDRESYTLLNPKQYSLITTDEDFKFFSNNINSNAKISYELLYKASIDGEAASVFHSLCDEKGASITVVKVLNGSKCGGFTPLSWKTEGCWQKDPSLRSFVCNLDNKTKFNLRENYSHALDFHNNKLSCFGGYTLQLTDKNLSNKNGICQACDYQIQSPTDLIGINENNFQAVDIEIFLVKEQ
jgi:WD40 repeat protein